MQTEQKQNTVKNPMDRAFAQLHLIRYFETRELATNLLSDPFAMEAFRRTYAADLADPKERGAFLDSILTDYENVCGLDGSEEQRWRTAIGESLLRYGMMLTRAEQILKM